MSTASLPPSANPYAAPSARVQEIIEDGTQEPAERATRLGAYFLDAAIIAIPAIVFAIVVPMFARQGGAEASAKLPPDGVLIALGITFSLYVLGVIILDCIWLHRYGQTVGKRMLKIRIVRTNGERCGLLRVIFARVLPVGLLGAIPLVGWLFQLGDPLLIFREDRRCLHDLIADTMVVKAA